jgi:hypothetical protein
MNGCHNRLIRHTISIRLRVMVAVLAFMTGALPSANAAPRHNAVKANDASRATALLDGGVTPMHLAVGGGTLVVARVLIDVADLDAIAMGETPIQVARKRNDNAMIQLLTSRGNQ